MELKAGLTYDEYWHRVSWYRGQCQRWRERRDACTRHWPMRLTEAQKNVNNFEHQRWDWYNDWLMRWEHEARMFQEKNSVVGTGFGEKVSTG